MTSHSVDEDWYTLDTLTFIDMDWYDPACLMGGFSMKVIEGLTHDREIVELIYYAEGDYIDRWVDVKGRVRDIAFWRPLRGRG
jgi:hypothetical protein